MLLRPLYIDVYLLGFWAFLGLWNLGPFGLLASYMSLGFFGLLWASLGYIFQLIKKIEQTFVLFSWHGVTLGIEP
jgi:hypothetical protein